MVYLNFIVTVAHSFRKKIFKAKVYKVHLNLSIALLLGLLLFVSGVETATGNTVSLFIQYATCTYITRLWFQIAYQENNIIIG